MRYIDDDGSILQHLGPYPTAVLAERHAFGEPKGWIVVERTVTDWEPVPTEPPLFIPEDD